MGTGRTDEFRKDAVRIALTSGLSRQQVADDLGVGKSTLNKWVTAHRDTDVVSSEDRDLARENEWLRLVLPEARVFEDIAPRLWDIDGDGVPEIVAVESDQHLGARLTAWTVQRTADGTHTVVLRAAGDFIGTRFRWLAPVGMADFTGDGRPEIAYVAMPHLARRLVLVRLDGARFLPVAQLDGISNHRIGEAFRQRRRGRPMKSRKVEFKGHSGEVLAARLDRS